MEALSTMEKAALTNRLGDMAPETGRTGAETVYPPHIKGFLRMLQTHFPTGAEQREWDKWDTRHYGRQVARLTGTQTVCLFDLLRERHTFRPSVAEVKSAVAELVAESAHLPDPNMGDGQARAYQSFTLPLPDRNAIAARTTDDAIAAARAEVERLRREKPIQQGTKTPTDGVTNATPKVAAIDPDKAARVKAQIQQARAELEAQGYYSAPNNSDVDNPAEGAIT